MSSQSMIPLTATTLKDMSSKDQGSGSSVAGSDDSTQDSPHGSWTGQELGKQQRLRAPVFTGRRTDIEIPQYWTASGGRSP
jgi:hypothetical protein